MQKLLFVAFALLIMGLTIQSCKKDDDSTDNATERSIAEDIMAHNDLSDLVDEDADTAFDGLTGDADERNDCPTITFAQPKGTWPNTVTLDYSEAGCTQGGRTFKGKVIITQTAPMNTAGATRTFTFDNFAVEGVEISGSKTVVNGGLNSDNDPYFSVTVDETFTYPDGTSATWQSTRVRTFTEGSSTPTRNDNVWTITGSSNGTSRNGVAYSSEITTPLVLTRPCTWISEGVITFTRNGLTRSLDLGDGTCDREATLTLPDGSTRTIKIRHHWWR
jgi:hypothetical protein